MILLDVNILIYACNTDAPEHLAAKRWLEKLSAGEEVVGLPWVTLWGFIRLATDRRVWSNPLSPEKAFFVVGEWLAYPDVVPVQPGPRHFDLLQKLVVTGRSAGRRLPDAVLAALALEYGATLASSDQDFRRYSGLRWVDPLAS